MIDFTPSIDRTSGRTTITEKKLTEADYMHLTDIFYKVGFNLKVFVSTLSLNGTHHVMMDLKF